MGIHFLNPGACNLETSKRKARLEIIVGGQGEFQARAKALTLFLFFVENH